MPQGQAPFLMLLIAESNGRGSLLLVSPCILSVTGSLSLPEAIPFMGLVSSL